MNNFIAALIFVTSCLFQDLVQGTSCEQRIDVTGTPGEIRSPNYPNDYPSNSRCTYYLESSSVSNHVTIKFPDFDVESHRSCSFDYVEIYDGPTKQSDSLGKHCGSNVQRSYSSSGRYLTIFFKSDDSVHGKGFRITYSAGCEYEYEANSGQMSSPNYPLAYPKDSNCTYSIFPTSGNQILLNITHFDLEDSGQCNFDRVELFLKQAGQEIARYCGGKEPFVKLVNTSKLFIRFISDQSVSRTGFQLQYRVSTDCSVANGGCSHYCRVIQSGKVLCSCNPGYKLDENGIKCIDIDECVSSPCGDVCTNNEGSFTCSCNKPGYQLSSDNKTCTDMTCKINNGGCEQVCQPFGEAQYNCACNNGFVLSSDFHNCSDIDECTTTNPVYRHHCEQLCFNEAGSYFCDCNEGYMLSSNGRSCEDEDECPDNEHVCDQRCVNIPGGWKCDCYEGYLVDPNNAHRCEDIDECALGTYPSSCSVCVNLDGSYSCVCKPGFLPNDVSTNCTDIDECLDNNGGCQQVCLNSPGSFTCQCLLGYEPVSNNSANCVDINECSLAPDGRGPCDQHCENAAGSFQCACAGGYMLLESGLRCQDIDECQGENKGGCQQDCKNAPGSFSCGCFPGFEQEDELCVDVDECSQNPCDQSVESSCSNSEGSFSCQCPQGYDVTNVTQCTDIDECASSGHGCMQICVNTPGTFHCECEAGYSQQDDKNCVDINECSRNPCAQSCVNTVGSFRCECNAGHYLLGDGFNCSDVNECVDGTHNCQQICVNQIGHFTCKCKDGYIQNSDNRTCTDIDECSSNTAGCSDGCVNTEGSFYCYCNKGYILGFNNKTCEDINECLNNNGGCAHFCNNNNGSYSCGCNPGYQYNGSHGCSDINECELSNGGCNQTCTNNPGSYECSCGPTYKLAADNQTCEHCPTCSEFSQVQLDVIELKKQKQTVTQLRDEIIRLGTLVTSLKTRISRIEERFEYEPLPSIPTGSPK